MSDPLERIALALDEQVAHVWMVRTFLKHSEEAEEDEEAEDEEAADEEEGSSASGDAKSPADEEDPKDAATSAVRRGNATVRVAPARVPAPGKPAASAATGKARPSILDTIKTKRPAKR